jgi:hypothetical protein
MSKFCILSDEQKICMECGECLMCDLDRDKHCDNCMKCVPKSDADYLSVEIDDVIAEEQVGVSPHEACVCECSHGQAPK